MGAPSKRLMLIRKLIRRRMQLIEQNDKVLDVPEKERLRVKVSNAGKKARTAIKAQAQRARQNIKGGAGRQVKRVTSNVKNAIAARKKEAAMTAYKIYMRKQQWER